MDKLLNNLYKNTNKWNIYACTGTHPSQHYQWSAASGSECYQEDTEPTFKVETKSGKIKRLWGKVQDEEEARKTEKNKGGM